MKSLPIDRPTLDDPLYDQRNPFQLFLLVFSVFASTPLLTGRSGSGTLDAELTTLPILLWGYSLLIGSLIALLGQYWRGHTWTALVLERCGLSLVGVGALVWASVLWTSVEDHDTVRYAVSVSSAYGLACLWRVGQIHVRLRYIRRLIREVNAHHAG